jgi:hypothetical protein
VSIQCLFLTSDQKRDYNRETKMMNPRMTQEAGNFVQRTMIAIVVITSATGSTYNFNYSVDKKVT